MASPVTTDSPTARFCGGLLDATTTPLPEPVSVAARRSLFNVLGTAIGAAHTPATEALLATSAQPRSNGPAEVTVPGLATTVDPHWGAIIAGTAAHFDDYDDTHLATVIHPGAAILGVLLALQPERPLPGSRYLAAFAFGCEAQLRIGNSISPSHYDRGWHITGTCGVFGAAVAAALLLELDSAGLANAIGLAATMTLGHREAFGSMTKPLHPGKAAANGLLAARLAAQRIDGIDDPLGADGVLSVLADRIDGAELIRGWDTQWELERNAFKPYPCGIVAHPSIDAAIAVSAQLGDPGNITSVEITCHPLVPELMGRRQPADGLQARFSAYHAAAVGLVDGEVGLAQFTTERATAPEIERLRGLTTLLPTPDCPRDSATLTATRTSGPPVTSHIAHARGSLDRPLTDAELFDKVDRLVTPVLGPESASGIDAAVRGLAAAPDLTELITSVRPTEQGARP
jgi:2-methylcitrate dehydratase PrpD